MSDDRSPEELLAQAEKIQRQADELHRSQLLEQQEQKRCRAAASAVEDAFEALCKPCSLIPPKEPTSQSLLAFHTALARGVAVLKRAGKYADWNRVNHSAQFESYRGGFSDTNEERVRVAYNWARHLVNHAFQEHLQEQDVLQAWKSPALRDAFRFVCLLLNGLSGKGRIELLERNGGGAIQSGGNIFIAAGDAGIHGDGGDVVIRAGNGSLTGAGGNLFIQAGDGGAHIDSVRERTGTNLPKPLNTIRATLKPNGSYCPACKSGGLDFSEEQDNGKVLCPMCRWSGSIKLVLNSFESGATIDQKGTMADVAVMIRNLLQSVVRAHADGGQSPPDLGMDAIRIAWRRISALPYWPDDHGSAEAIVTNIEAMDKLQRWIDWAERWSPSVHSADEILARQRSEQQRRKEEQKKEVEATRRQQELIEAFHSVRYCTPDTLPPGTEVYEEFARLFTNLISLLSMQGEFELLLERIGDISETECKEDCDARTFVSHLMGVAKAANQAEIARLLREAAELPFNVRLIEWLRRNLNSSLQQGKWPYAASLS